MRGFDSRPRLFHTVFNRTVENFHTAFTFCSMFLRLARPCGVKRATSRRSDGIVTRISQNLPWPEILQPSQSSTEPCLACSVLFLELEDSPGGSETRKERP